MNADGGYVFEALFLSFSRLFERQIGEEKEDTWHCWKIKSVTIRVPEMGNGHREIFVSLLYFD